MAFSMNPKNVIRTDYGKYINEARKYLYERKREE